MLKEIKEIELKNKLINNNTFLNNYDKFLAEFINLCYDIAALKPLTFPVSSNGDEMYFLFNGTKVLCSKIFEFIDTIETKEIEDPSFIIPNELKKEEDLINFICDNVFEVYEEFNDKIFHYPLNQLKYDAITKLKKGVK